MKLKEYLRKEKIDATQFAAQADIGITSIYRFLRGIKPSPIMIRRIEKATDGKVVATDWEGQHE